MADMLKKVTVQVLPPPPTADPGSTAWGWPVPCTTSSPMNGCRKQKASRWKRRAREGNPCPRAGTTWRRKLSASFGKNWETGHRPRISTRIEVPVSRGLGGSSTAIVAGLTAANALAGSPLSKEELVTEATRIEGHPDNVAPAILGGITVNVMGRGEGGKPEACPGQTPSAGGAGALHPPAHFQGPGGSAPGSVPQRCGVQLSRAALLVGSLFDPITSCGRPWKTGPALPLPLIPGAEEALEGARQAGAYNGIISGAGSTLLAYVPAEGDARKVGEAMAAPFRKRNIETVLHVLDIDPEGARVIDIQ